MNGDVHDFIAVELAGGKILVSLSLGDRNDVVLVGVTSGMALNDGEWHHVEVYMNGPVSAKVNIVILLIYCHAFLPMGLNHAAAILTPRRMKCFVNPRLTSFSTFSL